MTWRTIALLVVFAAGSGLAARPQVQSAPPPFELEEATIAQLRQWQASGRYTSRRLTELYLSRIRDLDTSGPALRAVIEVNPEALTIADQRDRERRAGRLRSPLHGVPVLIKDNIDTADRMMTTAGSLALVGTPVQRDAFIVRMLREAGAVLLGKTNLSEWANFRSPASTSGWSARGGQVRNPYVLDRSPCGSSAGTGAAIAANLAAVGVGTETDGSIVCPSAVHALVGIKPTVGLVSRTGIIPISHSQDTAGPMARTVADAAMLLGVLARADPRDDATRAPTRPVAVDYTAALKPTALQGARIGVVRHRYFGYSAPADRLVEAALAQMRARGAVLVDPANIATADDLGNCEIEVLLHEFKAGMNKYLAERRPAPRVRSLQAIIAFNEREREREMPFFGQELFILAEKKGAATEAAYRTARTTCRTLARDRGIDAVMDMHRLDALVAPTTGPAWVVNLRTGDAVSGSSARAAAVAGYPHVTVPAGFAGDLPVGLSFFGRAWSEPRLLALAYAYEQATRHRRPPRFRPTSVP